VFSGMLGVTIFGIFLTPVFYYVIVGLFGQPQAPATAAAAAPGPGAHEPTVMNVDSKPAKADVHAGEH
jgi:hypothetical protein